MPTPKIFESEYRFCLILWENEPIKSMDLAKLCKEKLDWEFITWVLWKGRTKESKQRYQSVLSHYPEKTIVVKNQRQLDAVQDYINKVIGK